MKYTTMQIYADDRATMHAWKRHYGLHCTADLIHYWIDAVRCHKQKEMYSRLLMPSVFKKAKPLEGKRIDKNRLMK